MKILYVADKEKTFGDASVPVQAITVEEGSILSDQSKIQSVASFLVIQGFVQAMQAKCHAFPYFSYVDNLAREILTTVWASRNPKKRGNNEGTISKRADGRWMARMSIGRDPHTGTLKRMLHLLS